ncbi:cation:H+ antiporter [Microlunatus sagamiharensis]|uniref:Cation:H+ antiporter n=1 Tax=Microlunatus sagamiharensis TaxID=546874 RepID=A0A1H2MNZ2_9ACTN|nr:sodium:proton exchanger [Microlunatus sagamiharensis]SDU94698.1 cation:H+ antiporter [Microlunatus sagamiharensis]
MRTLRPVLLCLAVALPAVAVRVGHVELAPGLALLVFGAAVVAASFVLAWAAEAAEVDIAGGLAIAVLAVIAVLPEYAVDLYFAYTAGSRPEYVQFAAANMTGSNRLLLGVGWSVVVILSLAVARRRTGRTVRALVLDPAYRVEIGFLALASLLALVVPATGRIPLLLGLVLLGVFVFYLVRVATTGDDEEPDLVGPAARIGALPGRVRRTVVAAMFVLAAGVILASAEPFAEALIASGQALGVDQFLLVQWLAPLASEAPELIVAVIFALRGKGAAALGLLVAAKVNQWTLLVGSLPVAYLLGGGSTALVLDGRQVEEFGLTIAQTLMAVAVLMTLRFPRWAAWTLLALFAVQFAVPGTGGRLVLTAVYAALAAVALVVNRQGILPALTAPFRRGPVLDDVTRVLPERELSGRR